MSEAADPAQPTALPPYELARDELTDIVRQLETGSASLDQCLQLWERGQFLAASCQTHLDAALQRVQTSNETPQERAPSA